MTLGVGLIGLGMATKPHLLSLRELEAGGRVKIVGGFAPSADRRAAFATEWNMPVFERQDALLDARGLDLVLVLTPPGTHLPVAQAAAKAGKHILVEKPVEFTVARGEQLAAAAEAAKVRCGVVLHTASAQPRCGSRPSSTRASLATFCRPALRSAGGATTITSSSPAAA